MSTIERAFEKLRADSSTPDHSRIAASDVGCDRDRNLTVGTRQVPEFASRNAAEQLGRKPQRKIVDQMKERGGNVFGDTGGYQEELEDEYRRIKRPLIANAFGLGAVPVEGGNVIMITSALPGEGKTFTALNLALSISMERDITVVLIDGDVIKRDLTQLLGLRQEPGLADILTGEELSVSDTLINTDLANLRVFPAGRHHPNATELLSSNRMRDLVTEIAARYPDRIILIDGPPIAVGMEGQAISALSGQVVFVVHAGETPQRVVKEALSLLNPNQAVGLVLNKIRNRLRAHGYGSYSVYR